MMEYELKLTEKDIQAIIASLGEQPAKLTMDTIIKITNQYKEQSDDKKD